MSGTQVNIQMDQVNSIVINNDGHLSPVFLTDSTIIPHEAKGFFPFNALKVVCLTLKINQSILITAYFYFSRAPELCIKPYNVIFFVEKNIDTNRLISQVRPKLYTLPPIYKLAFIYYTIRLLS